MFGSLKIGFLMPYSGVYPFYSQHLMAGILLGMGQQDLTRNNEIQFVPAYTKSGDARSVLEAVNKLVFFDQVDLISGLVSYKSIPEIIPVIENHGKLGFFFDMGEYIPYFEHLSPRIFYSSQQIWQSQYALGHWAQKQFGGTGVMVMPVYEAGYHLSGAFYKGAGDAGSNQIGLHVIPRDTTAPLKLNLDPFFSELKRISPSYVHAIFAGSMGNDFLQQWCNSEFNKSIPLTVIENMIYDDVLEDISSLDIEVYSAISWSRGAESKRNKDFVTKFETAGGQMANIFGLLGYEAGLALKEVKSHLFKRDFSTVMTLLQKESVEGPRGERNFYPLSGFSLPTIDVVKVKTSLNKIYKTILSQGNGLKFDSPVFKQIHDESMSGWQNPYLCM